MKHLDQLIQNYFILARTPFLTEFNYLLTTLFDLSLNFLLVVLCVSFLIYLVRNLRYSLLFFGTLMFGAVTVYFLKLIFNINRPLDPVLSTFGKSFPSYHATIATIFFVMLMYIFDSYFSKFSRIIFNTLCVICILLVSISRIYLGVHWLSDVIFGIFWGILISYIGVMIFKKLWKMS